MLGGDSGCAIMKKKTKTFLILLLKIFGISGIILIAWIGLCFMNIHCRLLTLNLLRLADIYSAVGTVFIHTPDGIKTISIYKQHNKPFLLVGPYNFDRDYHDFFFVAKDCVLRTATDKGSEWTIAGNYLLLNDDMSNSRNRLRAPYWFDATQTDGRISLNAQTQCYDFKISLDEKGKELATFSIPVKFFTVDMPSYQSVLK